MSSGIGIDQVARDIGIGGYGPSIKSLILLFIVCIIVLSTPFHNYVIGNVKGATTNNKNETTSFGVMLQAVCVVLLYALTTCLESFGVL